GRNYSEPSTSSPSSDLTDPEDETMDLHSAGGAGFGDEPLSFDQLFPEDTGHSAMTMNGFTAINDPTASNSTLAETVSPADLLYGHDFSAPNSNSFTNL